MRRQPDYSKMLALIFGRLDKIEKHISVISQPPFDENDEIVDTRKMRLLTKMSDRTLLRRRIEGSLPYFRYGGKVYYHKSQALRALRQPNPTQLKNR